MLQEDYSYMEAQMGKKKLNGYFTVEAALIMPVVICVLSLLCYLGFFMCNRCLLLQDAYILGLRGSLEEGLSNEETAAYILKQGNELLPKYYALSKIDKNVKVEIGEISVELCCEMKVPFAFLAWEEEKMNNVWEIREEKKFDRTKPVDFIRACRKVEKLVD